MCRSEFARCSPVHAIKINVPRDRIYSRRSGGCAGSTHACPGPVPVTAMTAGSVAPGSAATIQRIA